MCHIGRSNENNMIMIVDITKYVYFICKPCIPFIVWTILSSITETFLVGKFCQKFALLMTWRERWLKFQVLWSQKKIPEDYKLTVWYISIYKCFQIHF